VDESRAAGPCVRRDSRAEVDMNVVMDGRRAFRGDTGDGGGTAVFRSEMQDLLAWRAGIRRLNEAQRLGAAGQIGCSWPLRFCWQSSEIIQAQGKS